MTNYSVHTIESAPEGSKQALRQLQSSFGMIPNILGVMSTSPVLINSLVGLFGRVHGASFTEAQVQILLLTDAVTNANSSGDRLMRRVTIPATAMDQCNHLARRPRSGAAANNSGARRVPAAAGAARSSD